MSSNTSSPDGNRPRSTRPWTGPFRPILPAPSRWYGVASLLASQPDQPQPNHDQPPRPEGSVLIQASLARIPPQGTWPWLTWYNPELDRRICQARQPCVSLEFEIRNAPGGVVGRWFRAPLADHSELDHRDPWFTLEVCGRLDSAALDGTLQPTGSRAWREAVNGDAGTFESLEQMGATIVRGLLEELRSCIDARGGVQIGLDEAKVICDAMARYKLRLEEWEARRVSGLDRVVNRRSTDSPRRSTPVDAVVPSLSREDAVVGRRGSPGIG